MKQIKTLFMLLALTFSGLTNAALEPFSEVVEMAVSELRVPANEAARITVKPCSSCELRTVRVTNRTTYRVGKNGELLTLREFRAAAADLASDDAALATLKYEVDTGIVTAIVIRGSE